MLIVKAILRFRVKPLQSVFFLQQHGGIAPENPNPDHKQKGLKAGFAIIAFRLHSSDVAVTRFFTGVEQNIDL